ncbi:8205_t:CDS:2 [Paraglomus brasilianum]|uniref:8205_t:CDS:1 n=1 Tax=Paraglomus brasilianum TaxID=144538 RepID=A0A9N8ZX60_9GLOM|nr:8205_t:CDS:2 [Paraglomus brasilianum]
MNLQRKLELVLPGKSPDEILKSHEVNKYDHSVVLWKIENTQRGYTITHKLKPLDKDNTKESTKSKTQHFPRNDTVRLIDLNIRELIILSPAVPRLANLQRLYIQFNKLKTLPLELFRLTGLQELRLNSNQLTTIPPHVGLLTSLQRLDVRSNKLTSIPQQIGLCIKCHVLDLRNNRLKVLPAEVQNLTKLRELMVDGNPLDHVAGIDDRQRENDNDADNTLGMERHNTAANEDDNSNDTVIKAYNKNTKVMSLTDICTQIVGSVLHNKGPHAYCKYCRHQSDFEADENCLMAVLPHRILERLTLPAGHPPKRCSGCVSPLFHDALKHLIHVNFCKRSLPIEYKFCSHGCMQRTLRQTEEVSIR